MVSKFFDSLAPSSMEQMAGPRPPDVSIGYRLLVGTTVTFVCAFIVVSLRGVARSLYARMSWDDYLTIFALVSHSLHYPVVRGDI